MPGLQKSVSCPLRVEKVFYFFVFVGPERGLEGLLDGRDSPAEEGER